MATLLGITKRNTEKNVKALRDEGVIARVGNKRTGNWKVL